MVRLGDFANVFALVNTAAFLGYVMADEYGLVGKLSPSFKRDGFCVSWPGTLYSSHHLSFRVDAVCAVALVFLYRKHRGTMKGLEPVENAAAGVLFHGLGHYGISTREQDGGEPDRRLQTLIPATIGMFLFFFFLFKSAPNVDAKNAAINSAIHAPILVFLVPERFGFIYVQTVLLWVATLYSLAKKEKDRFYDLSSLVITVPVGLVSWVEAMTCDVFLKSVGGHVYYDAIIPASMFLYYYLALQKQEEPTTEAKKVA